jgi:SAM-dependent methyltransferase
MIKELVSFYQRRIYIPKESQGLVLDVGSGDKPHFSSDILVDKFVDKKYGSQRNGSDIVLINKPLFVSDIVDLPFKDKIFDFVIASHLLEHVIDPASAIKEIVRVGKAGYIEVPYCGYQKLIDFCSHLWYCDYKNNTLIFTAKKDMIFDKDIDTFVVNNKDRTDFNINIKDGEKCILKIYWKDNLKCKVIGKPNKNLMKIIEKTTINRNSLISIIRTVLGFILEKSIRTNKKLHYNDLVKTNYKIDSNPLLKNRAYTPSD